VTHDPLGAAHGDEVEDYSAPFIELIDRDVSDLSADDRESLEYYYASVNLAQGLPADSPPRRWCLMAQEVERIAYMLGRVPRSGDPGTTPQIVAWINAQRGAPLNSYQQVRLRSLPGGFARVV